jgi:hypothetical protein
LRGEIGVSKQKKRTDGDLLRGESNFVVGDCRWLPDSDVQAEKRGIPEDFLAFDKLFIIIPGMVVVGL